MIIKIEIVESNKRAGRIKSLLNVWEYIINVYQAEFLMIFPD